MSLHPYLFFGGDCRQAMTRYHQVLGGELEVTTFADAPPEASPPGVDGAMVMHANLTLGEGMALFASDDPSGDFDGHKGVAVAWSARSVEEATRIFEGLGEGGQVLMPLTKTFWAPAFGMVQDAFGVQWMIDTYPEDSAQAG